MARPRNPQTIKMVAVIFTKAEQKIFREYKKVYDFRNSADAYRGLLDLVDEKWTGVMLKSDQRFSIRVNMSDYNSIEEIRQKLGGITRTEVLRRGINFLHDAISDEEEFMKWKEFATTIPRFERTGKKKENGLRLGKLVMYAMNDLSHQILKDVCEAYGEDKTGALRLALEIAKVLPPEMLMKEEEEKFNSTVRLREAEWEKMEKLKKRLNYNGNGIFRTGIFLAGRKLKLRKMNKESRKNCLSVESELYQMTKAIPADTVRQNVILRP